MGRKLFLSHVADAGLVMKDGIQDVLSPDEGIVTFTYIYSANPLHKVDIQACATDLGEYPYGNSFILYTKDDTTESVIPKTLQKISEDAHGKSLTKVLSDVSQILARALSVGSPPAEVMTIESSPAVASNSKQQEDDGDFDFDFEGASDEEVFGLADRQPGSTAHASEDILDTSTTPYHNTQQMKKIRADLKVVKNSGFRVGVFGNLTTSGLLCVSIRVSKLGLSDETLEAWSIPRKNYLVLLIKYIRGYRDATSVAGDKDLKSLIQMRVGLCQHYKPSLSHVLGVFQRTSPDNAMSKVNTKDAAGDEQPFEPFIVSKPLNQFLEERLIKIIFARDSYQLSWLGAEKLIAERQASAASESAMDMKPYQCEDLTKAKGLPPIVVADHMRHIILSQASLPLIMMQFVLRHVVRCTEFCLVCHCRVDESFEAMKPYVCMKPLCLYQYMALGFGPSLEWEIIKQPFVVDLLVSFCYAAAYNGGMTDVPAGMNLICPSTTTSNRFYQYRSNDLWDPAAISISARQCC